MSKDTGPSYDNLATAFRHHNFDPLYFFFGEETFLIDELQELLIEEALEPSQHDFNLDVVYGSEAEASEVIGLARLQRLLDEQLLQLVDQERLLPEEEVEGIEVLVPKGRCQIVVGRTRIF